MKKIIFIDIDGTLTNDSKEITQRTKNAIKKLLTKGIYVVIASGRYRKYTENTSKEALASNYIISSNGGEIYDYKNKKIIYENNLDKKTIIYLYNIAKEYEIEFLMNSRDDRISSFSSDNQKLVLNASIEKILKSRPSAQCVLIGKEIEKIKEVKNKIETLKDIKIINLSKCLVDSNCQIGNSLFLDAVRKETNKGNAIKILCEYLKIDIKDSVAIGDSYNDLSMFEVVRT